MSKEQKSGFEALSALPRSSMASLFVRAKVQKQSKCPPTDEWINRWFSSVQFSWSVMSDSLWPHGLQHTRAPCPSPTPRVYQNSCPLSRWCHPTVSSSVVPFYSHLQSGSFLSFFFININIFNWMSQLFTWGGQSTGVSATASVLPMNTQHWFPLGWTGWISLQSEGLSSVFSKTTVPMHQFFSTQLSL